MTPFTESLTGAVKTSPSGILCSPAQTMAEVLEDPQMHAAGAFVQVTNPEGEPYRSVNGPITFRGNPLTHTRPSPAVGQHTAEVLEEIGVDPGSV